MADGTQGKQRTLCQGLRTLQKCKHSPWRRNYSSWGHNHSLSRGYHFSWILKHSARHEYSSSWRVLMPCPPVMHQDTLEVNCDAIAAFSSIAILEISRNQRDFRWARLQVTIFFASLILIKSWRRQKWSTLTSIFCISLIKALLLHNVVQR